MSCYLLLTRLMARSARATIVSTVYCRMFEKSDLLKPGTEELRYPELFERVVVALGKIVILKPFPLLENTDRIAFCYKPESGNASA